MEDKIRLVNLYLHSLLCEYLDGNYKQARFWQTLLREINELYPEAFFSLDKYDLGMFFWVGQKTHWPGQGQGLVKTAIGATPESVRMARFFNNFSSFSCLLMLPCLSNL